MTSDFTKPRITRIWRIYSWIDKKHELQDFIGRLL